MTLTRPAVFLAFFVLTLAYALVRGGKPERLAAVCYAAAYFATVAIQISTQLHFAWVEWGIFAVDCILLVALIHIALRANRYWVIWVASLQLVAILAHLAKAVVPDIAAPAYAVSTVIWSYGSLPVLVLATYRHRRRLLRDGADRAWSWPPSHQLPT